MPEKAIATDLGQPQLEEKAQSRMSGYAIYVLVLLSLANVLNYMDRLALSVLLPAIKADLQLTDSELGLLTGFAFSICYAVCGIPIARLADVGVRKNIVAAALVIWSGATAACGAALGFWQLFATRIFVGAGEAGCIAPSQSIICDYVPSERRSSALAFHIAGTIVGTALSIVISAQLERLVGWRWTFALLGVPGFVLATVIWLTLREPKRGQMDRSVLRAPSRIGVRETFTVLAGNHVFRLIVIFYVLTGFLQNGFNQWLASFYTRVHGVSPADFGLALGIAMGAGSGLGLVLGGLLADRLASQGLATPLRASAIATLLAVPTALLCLFAGHMATSIVMVGLASAMWSMSNGPLIASIFEVTPPSMRAVAVAVPTFFGSVIGMGLGPLSVGLASDHLAPTIGAEALRYALVLPICALPLIALVLWRTSVGIARCR